MDDGPAPYTVDPAVNLRRSSLLAAVLGLSSVGVTAGLGHPLMGVFVCFGLALGAFNNRLLQRAVRSYGTDTFPTKGQFRFGVFRRLALITVLALAIAVVVRPDGLGTFFGLALFQILMLVGAALPVFRSLRPSS